jgi:hypothetical protein
MTAATAGRRPTWTVFDGCGWPMDGCQTNKSLLLLFFRKEQER